MIRPSRSFAFTLAAALSLAGCSSPSAVGPDTRAAQAPAAAEAQGVTAHSTPPFVFPDGCCYYQDRIVRTVVPPAANPREGRDAFYGIVNGVAGQKGVVAVAPGDTDYHGGHWAFYSVTFQAAPYLLTSASGVLAAEAAGDVTIARVPANDFKCPIQP
jgi:hypothetical protein